MIVMKENEKLFPGTWEYNAARITSEIAKIVENAGGRVKYGNTAIIQNRHITGAIFEKEERLKQLKTLNAENEKEIRTDHIKALEKEIEELKQIKNDPISVTHTGYITFVFNNVYYSYSMDSNPFFPFHYYKTPIKDGKYSRDAAGEEDKKEWLYDCFYSWKCSDADVKEAANLIFNMLCNAPFSDIIRDGRRQRVENTYNNGYHYEIIYAPERVGKIDF